MRELSFRIWDKKEKTMFLSPIEIEHLGSWFDAHLPGAIADTGNKIVMQYTGLKDKNGKKIFEGDIVTRCGGEKYQGVYEHEDTVVVADTIDIVMLGEFQELFVLGNIHDNPELLEEELK